MKESVAYKESPLAVSINESLERNGMVILPPMDVMEAFDLVADIGYYFKVSMLDPWYNKGIGGVRDDYDEFVVNFLKKAACISDHVYLWGFPEIVALFITKIPDPLKYNCWLTWYYKNNPSVIRGWRSAQQTCLHMSKPTAKMYLEPFLNEKQLELKAKGKLRYMPGPTSVIEVALNIGFVGKKEQTGHPSQKPEKVYDPLYKITTQKNDLVFDPMAGSGTTGAIARKNGFKAILCDQNPEYIEIMEKRLGVKHIILEK